MRNEKCKMVNETGLLRTSQRQSVKCGMKDVICKIVGAISDCPIILLLIIGLLSTNILFAEDEYEPLFIMNAEYVGAISNRQNEDFIEPTIPYSFVLSKNPTKAALFSAFVPGLGQVYNEQYIKAGAVIGIQTWFVGRTFHHDRRMKDHRRRRNSVNREEDMALYAHYNNLYRESYESRQSNLFWIGAFIFLSTMDAYVDAHLINFKDKRNEVRLKFEDQMLQVSIGF